MWQQFRDDGVIKMAIQKNDERFFQEAEATGIFEIRPCENIASIETRPNMKKLELTNEQKIRVDSLLQQVPSAIAAGTMAQAYVVKFPKGMPHTLMQYRNGGVGSQIMGENGIVAHASFHSISAQAAVLGAFTAISVATGQYFLSKINNDLNVMKLNLDKILEFLYGNKKAELMSEVSFVKYAYQNYNSIMEYEAQRAATIISLQEAKKVAMKDVEFYIGDLDSTVNSKDHSDIISLSDKAFQIKESLDLSMQLYGMSNILEVFYSQNHDPDYIRYIEKDISSYIDKCEKRMLSSFSALNILVKTFKGKPWEKVNTVAIEKQVNKLVELLNSGEESDMRKTLCSTLRASVEKAEYYISREGGVYLKTA